ncbi:Metallo-dependent phosphatase-like protein [Cantharellus anzutake]|uniref:Metallo-dependent phosphatase-like protein n=1 Tax=Cantharellus anzutake TaxID=1750568 RepID=UPI001905909D|nr:Metallo-dependent phosphatase-like protein [Cantharellus anzutake]KAF8342584.1 Metallo-dependent phosphatase-like protein [Cantharellus anzutake]
MSNKGISLALFLGVLALRACACAGEHSNEHFHAKRSFPGATQTTAWPSAPLVWGDVNFLHTTDSHGHTKASYPEPNYSGDFGDFKSFVTHMKQEALKRGVDLLLVDSGDIHDGSALSDGGPPGSIDGTETNKLIEQLPYDILAIGNHELYVYNVTFDMYKYFAPKQDGKYLSSNVNITVNDGNGKIISTPVGSRYRKFKTLFGRKVTALAYLNTTVQTVQNMVKEPWFAAAITEEPDFFLLVGHMPIARDNWPVVFNAIRAVHPLTPIFIFGGHSHIRDCNQLDPRSMSLESGRYMETVGWMSAQLPPKHLITNTTTLNVTRRYLDANRNTYMYHTKKKQFDTAGGLILSEEIVHLAKKYNISYQFGTAPQDYYLSRAAYPSNASVLTLLVNEVMPVGLAIANPARASVPNIAVTNAGSQRFDIYSGPFTRNDEFVVSPFNNGFLYVTVPFSVGRRVLGVLNNQGAPGKRGNNLETETEEEYARGYVEGRFNAWIRNMWAAAPADLKRVQNANLTLGYMTNDSCPGVGDDTLHSPMPHYSSPAYIGSPTPTGLTDSDPMDVIFPDFFEAQILLVINSLQNTKNYTAADISTYGNVYTNTIYGIFAEAKWK